MVQFKDYFISKKKAPFTRATSVQKCLRIGGKHNDLEVVGTTCRHHTYFEMLGNFSFGDYGKRDAINFAWKFLREELQLPASRLAVSVLKGDDEAVEYWTKDQGVPSSRIFHLNNEDNFWMMSATSGPCGPCSEIFWDQEWEVDGSRFLEIWNLVFMQYEQGIGEDGKIEYKPLPSVCIDTGMGLERIASVLQGKPNNFQIDTMQGMRYTLMCLLSNASRATTPDRLELGIRVVMDHVRAVVMLLSEGVLPEGSGRGHVLRRLIRRASLFGHKIGIDEPFLHHLVPDVVSGLGESYPEIGTRLKHILNIITFEELAFNKALRGAKKRLGSVMKIDEVKIATTRETGRVTAEMALELHSSFGIPIDIVVDIAREHGLLVDLHGFNKLKEDQIRITKNSWVGSGDATVPPALLSWADQKCFPQFVGYDQLTSETTIAASWIPPMELSKNDESKRNGLNNTNGPHVGIAPTSPDGNPTPSYSLLETCEEPLTVWMVPLSCPFYPEGGGQVGDLGHVEFLLPSGTKIMGSVVDTITPYMGGIACKVC
eukprot:TRINITY_DN7934_c1_g1_i4.p1 TRINITY_DN7934_c1_g1~~TRINITY_DN7934_c1_g1_i4.p1  ORF type:complete len:543 (-),score=103.41 TRINITY_DN7934_c1_g1_i4:1273-2901(-)